MRSKIIFFRTLKITSIIILNLFVLVYGICHAYKNIRLLAYGEYVQIIEVNENYIKLFDYNIKLPDY